MGKRVPSGSTVTALLYTFQSELVQTGRRRAACPHVRRVPASGQVTAGGLMAGGYSAGPPIQDASSSPGLGSGLAARSGRRSSPRRTRPAAPSPWERASPPWAPAPREAAHSRPRSPCRAALRRRAASSARPTRGGRRRGSGTQLAERPLARHDQVALALVVQLDAPTERPAHPPQQVRLAERVDPRVYRRLPRCGRGAGSGCALATAIVASGRASATIAVSRRTAARTERDAAPRQVPGSLPGDPSEVDWRMLRRSTHCAVTPGG